ncbi:MAG TPA: prepilin-type N-terminal cleavage/methylation domain-containing protein [Terriglobia bacterium]|nr:prepilin-type N-terminal cleavage/methylation domain-containing protein [Terriglobia bacterium]
MKKQEPTIRRLYQRGFTLMGLMAALAVVAAMLAFVIPSLSVAGEGPQAEGLD